MIVNSQSLIAEMYRILSAGDTVAIDTETTGLRWPKSETYMISMANEHESFVVPQTIIPFVTPVINDLAKRRLFIGHNIAFDLHFLRKNGIELPNVFDTMVAQQTVDENQDLGLKSLAMMKLGFRDDLPSYSDLAKDVKKKLKLKKMGDVTIDMIDFQLLADYAERDAVLTHKLYNVSLAELQREGMLEMFRDVEMPFTKLLFNIEHTGIHIDIPRTAALHEEFTALAEQFHDEWDKATGGVNPASTKQLGEYVYGTLGFEPEIFTDKGAPSTSALAISRLLEHDKTGTLRLLMDWRAVSKLTSTYTSTLLTDNIDGVIYCDLNQTGAATGRLSSSNPNMQNIPARGERGSQLRELFIAPDGESLIDPDYSQLEMRIGAHYTKDRNLVELFANDGDPHALTMELCDVARYVAKNLNFGCVPMSYKALTPYGVVNFDNLDIGDTVIGYDIETNTMRPTKVLDKVKYNDAPVVNIQVDEDVLDVTTTGNHRWATRRGMTTTYGLNSEDSLILSAPYVSEKVLDISESEAAVIGWLFTDGYMKYKDASLLDAGITHGTSDGRQHIESALVQSCIGYTTHTDKNTGMVHYLMSIYDIRPILSRAGLARADSNLADFVLKLTASQRAAFNTACYLSNSGTTEATRLGQFLSGVYSNGYTLSKSGTIDMQGLAFTYADTQDVWCITTELGTWVMVTDDGTPMVTGNSFYGAGPRTLADTIEKSGQPRPKLGQAKDWLNRFNLAYPDIKKWKDSVVVYATQLGYVKTLAGRKRRLPDLRSKDDALRSRAQRQAVNAIIQGSAADVVKLAMLNVADETLDKYDAKMLLQVHDEILLSAPDAAAEEAAAEVSAIMVETGNQLGMRVQLKAEPGIGKTWAAAH